MKALFPAPVIALLMAVLASASACGSVRHLSELSTDEKQKLQASEERVVKYDRALQAIDRLRAQGQMSRQDYDFRTREFVSFIGGEAKYQNDLLTRSSTFPDDAREVLENVAKYAIEVPLVLGAIVLKGMAGSSFSVSP
jgi:hypothetical protein